MADLFNFRTLGTLELMCGSRSLGLVRRRRRLALFAFLAVSRSPYQSRDILQAMFWPESDQSRARHSLNVVLHELRNELGKGVILSRGNDEVGIAAGRVWCDANAFEEALAMGDPGLAMDLYGGDLMHGFHIRGAPEFERWLDQERERLRRGAHSAAWKCAEQAEQRGDGIEAAALARRVAAMSAHDEIVAQRSIRLLDRLGDRAGAVELFERLVRCLREEFDVEPAPETQRLIAGIRARLEPVSPVRSSAPPLVTGTSGRDGSAASAPVEAGQGPESPALPGVQRSGDATVVPASRVSARVLPFRAARNVVMVASLAVFTGAAFWMTRQSGPALQVAGGADQRPAIIVSPFESLGGDPDLGYLAPAVTAAVTEQLAEVTAVELLVEDSYRVEPDTDGPLNVGAPSREVFVVRGNVLSASDRVRVRVQLIDGTDGNILRATTLELPTADVFGLIDDVAQEVGALLRSELGREIRLRQWRARTEGIRAWELVQQAEVQRQRAKLLREQGSYSGAATELDRADSLLALAEVEDPEWTDPLVWRARVASDAAWLYFLPPRRDTAAVRDRIRSGVGHAERAIERDTTQAAAFELRGMLLHWSSFMASHGEADARTLLRQAENDLRRAVSLDPDRARAWSLLNALVFARGDFENAYWTAQRAYEADAYLEAREEILANLALAAYEIGMDSVAWDWCLTLPAEAPVGAYCRLSLLAWVGARDVGSPTDPWEIVERVPVAMAAAQGMQGPLEMLVATVLARTGLADSARAVARRAARAHPADDELLLFEAGARVALGEAEAAASLLRRYVTADPAHRLGAIRSRRFSGLESLLRDLLARDH